MKRAAFAKTLLEWYDRAGRDLPWRAKGGVAPDPYHIWLSEIILQQTRVNQGLPYYEKFIEATDLIMRGGAFGVSGYAELESNYELMVSHPENFSPSLRSNQVLCKRKPWSHRKNYESLPKPAYRMTGRVLKSTGSWYEVAGANSKLYACRVRGKLRLEGYKESNPIAVGDSVEIEPESSEEDYAMINTLYPRKNYIIRKSNNLSKQTHIIGANLDIAALVVT
ncbi:MAG: hypothetical protein HC788_08740, partial [Sphingopyxis sp.]|nr:hypothetical protein [Sphingopyxis sp.]